MRIFLFFNISFIMRCTDIFDKFASSAISFNVNHRSSLITVATIDMFVDSEDMRGYPKCGSSFTNSSPSLNFVDHLESLERFKVLASHLPQQAVNFYSCTTS